MAKDKRKKTLFGKAWQYLTQNPVAAFSLAGLAFGAFKDFYPKAYDSTISFLDMDPTTTYKKPSPIAGTRQLNVYGQPSKYTSGYNQTVAATDIFGNTKGLVYDLQKGIGQTISMVPKMGALFSGKGPVYNYILGRGSFSDLKMSAKNILPDFLSARNKKFAEWGELYKAYRNKEKFSGGGLGGNNRGNQEISARRSRGYSGSGLASPDYRAGKITPFDPMRLSANLLRTAYKDEYLTFINRPAKQSGARGTNIDFRAPIKIRKRKV